MNELSGLIEATGSLNQIYRPVFFRLKNTQDQQALTALIADRQVSIVHDNYEEQLKELLKMQHPTIKLKADDYQRLIADRHAGKNPDEEGVWVYFPWNKKLIHLLDEEEFIEVRTNRNRYKITLDEQHSLQQKAIGIVGLSVGHSIALTIAMERICGELRLADFDTAELSNLNRLRTPLFNLGINKTVIAAREIAEIDPFLRVEIFNDGLHNGNMDAFFIGNQKLDLFIEVCDGLDIKIQSRYKARELNIPVVMDTNDRGMLDVERFDLEPQRPVLHGLADGLDPDNIKDLTNEQKVPYILRMIGAETISTRLKASMLEVEQSINTWPQLASSVTLGGALTTDVCRRILLDQYHESGRYYIDLEELVKDEHVAKEVQPSANPYQPLTRDQQTDSIKKYFEEHQAATFKPDEQQLHRIVDAALAAPSAGNNQPWVWVYHEGLLFLFHDKYKSWSWGDYYEMGSHMSLGAALENVHLQASAIGLAGNAEIFPTGAATQIAAVIRFEKQDQVVLGEDTKLANEIFTRRTNRRIDVRKPIDASFYDKAQSALNEFKGISLYHTESEEDLAELADIIAECDKVRLLNKLGHEEFYHELRWDRAEADQKRDGVEIEAVDISQSDIAGFKVAGDWKAVELISDWKKGSAFKKLSLKAVKSAGSMALITIPSLTHTGLIEAGKAVEKLWLLSAAESIAVHPMLSPVFFFNRLVHGNAEQLTPDEIENLTRLRERFLKIFPAGKENQTEVFLMKLALADDYGPKSLRKNKDELFYQF
ncbi:Rv1355c family protein [Mucilaginibacter sp. UR6-1]|uniref:Rv1355c family protein n=1 Tax=Mucilaginibacter sp. UR6-1 TaxID=1435643 RepID=UPI001E35CE1C|nr:Rv1355c family protein [Mucilaginibacter sp. UR6-1]MCC8409305.1 Rv1355c family protein [Mucilaginibacter sp. UR6-1]